MLARIARGGAAVALAMGTSGLMVAWSGPAQASEAVAVRPMLTLVKTAGGAGLRLASPYLSASAAAVCATGVGCAALGVAAAGMALYATQDMWVPWVKNAFGGAETSETPGNGTVYPLSYSFVGDVTAPDYRLNLAWVAGQAACGGSCGDYHNTYQSTLVCKSPAGVLVQYATTGVLGGTIGFKARATSGTSVITDGGYTAGCGLGASFGRGGPDGSTVHSLSLQFRAQQSAELSNRIVIGAPASSVWSQARVNCKRPDGSMYEVIGATQLNNGDVLMPTCVDAAAIAAGTSTEGSTGNCYTLSASVASALGPFLDQESNCGAVNASEALYPNCVGGTVGCTYVIRHNGETCDIGVAGCQNWPALAEITPSEYQCYYGSYLVGLGACSFLERAYEEANQPVAGVGGLEATGPNTDGDPRTSTAPAPAIDPPATPRVAPEPATTTPTAPLPGEGSTQAPTIGQDCWPSGYSAFNPAAWVLQPIQCALRWAFIPRPGSIGTDAITAQLDRAGIGPSVAALTTAVGSLGGAEGGCAGPTIEFDIATVHQDITPFAACTEPMSTVAGYAYALISVITVVGGAGKIVTMVAHGFGYGAPSPTWQQGTLF